MAESEVRAEASVLVPGAHRLIRVLGTSEGPFEGSLITSGSSVAVCADAAGLPEWEGWRHAGAEHVAGAIDVYRRIGGQDVLLPWCTERVGVFLARRLSAATPLSAGEVGTLVLSTVRGLRELGAEAQSAQGDWWLTHDGCPLFVHGAGPAAVDGASHLLRQVGANIDDRELRGIVAGIGAGITAPRISMQDEQRWESELFAVAAPRALRTEVFAPEPARDVDARRGLRADVRSPADADGPRGRRWRDMLERLSVAVERAWGAVRAACRIGGQAERTHKDVDEAPRSSSHRRPLLFAGAAAVAVLAVGALWPADASEPVAEPSARSTAAPSSSAEAAPEQLASPPPVDDVASTAPADSAAASVPGLLDEIASCAADGDLLCTSAIAEGAALPESGAATEGSKASAVTPVDDYGDLAVVRLTPSEGDGEQMLVLVRQKQIWLVRDVYDVADQPE